MYVVKFLFILVSRSSALLRRQRRSLTRDLFKGPSAPREPARYVFVFTIGGADGGALGAEDGGPGFDKAVFTLLTRLDLRACFHNLYRPGSPPFDFGSLLLPLIKRLATLSNLPLL